MTVSALGAIRPHLDLCTNARYRLSFFFISHVMPPERYSWFDVDGYDPRVLLQLPLVLAALVAVIRERIGSMTTRSEPRRESLTPAPPPG